MTSASHHILCCVSLFARRPIRSRRPSPPATKTQRSVARSHKPSVSIKSFNNRRIRSHSNNDRWVSTSINPFHRPWRQHCTCSECIAKPVFHPLDQQSGIHCTSTARSSCWIWTFSAEREHTYSLDTAQHLTHQSCVRFPASQINS